ncbi:hypothetical protein [Thermococcus sp.]|uniref:hypothetical protein n=1 Tax=Thermococcus sp. TaxID=35749 RepID=UPI002604C540|nr:hypothetical protein [Thermococcus sp.]
MLGMTSGSAAATVWGVPAGQATGRTDEGIDPHLQVSGAYDGVSVSFSVSWNDHHGAAWGLYQYGLYDDTINKFILFSHGYRYSVKNYQTPLIHITKISYSVDINMGYTYGYISSWGGYNIVTPYHVTVKEKVSHLLGGSDTKTIVDTSGTLQGYIPDPNKVLSTENSSN